MSKGNDAIVYVFEHGYRVREDGAILNPQGRHLKGSLDSRGYLCIRIGRVRHPIHGTWSPKALAHRLVAYQLFGAALFEPDVIARHRDDNRLNNAHDNILLGSHADNAEDRHRNHGTHRRTEERVCASKACRTKFTADAGSEQVFCSLACVHYAQRRAPRPSKAALTAAVWSTPATQLAQKYGVTDTTIKDWCRTHGVEKPPRGYWAKQRSKAP